MSFDGTFPNYETPSTDTQAAQVVLSNAFRATGQVNVNTQDPNPDPSHFAAKSK